MCRVRHHVFLVLLSKCLALAFGQGVLPDMIKQVGSLFDNLLRVLLLGCCVLNDALQLAFPHLHDRVLPLHLKNMCHLLPLICCRQRQVVLRLI